MRFHRALAIAVFAILALVSCTRDPNVAKKRYLDSGNKYFANGKYKEASIMYRNALQKDQRYGPAHYHLGLTYIKLGQLGGAVQSLRRAVELLPNDQPDHWDAVVQLSDVYLSVTREKQYLDEVDGYVQQLLKRDANSFDGHRLAGDLNFIRVNEALRNSQREQAIKYLDEAIGEYRKADAITPGTRGVSLQLARAVATKGDPVSAMQLYRGVIAKDKTLDAPYMELYRLYMVTGKPDEGANVLRLAFVNNPKKFQFLTLLASHYYGVNRPQDMLRVLEEIKSHAGDFDQSYLTVGDFFARMGKPDDAIREYREGESKDSKKKVAYQKRIVDILLSEGKRDEAGSLNAEILKANPNDSDARGVAATLLLDKGDLNNAYAEMQSIALKNPENPTAHFNLGRAHALRGESEQARQQLQKALELRPGYVAARMALAQLQIRLGEYDGALQNAAQLLAIDRGDVNARLVQSAALMGLKRYADARAILTDTLKAKPDSRDALFQLGYLDALEKKYPDAEDVFRRAYQLDTSNSQALMGLVQTYMSENKPDQALRTLQTEIEKAPQRVDLRVDLGNMSVLAGKYDTAIDEYKQALASLSSGSKARGDLYLRLGETYRRKGDLANAISALEQARAMLPDNAAVIGTLARVLDGAGRKTEARQYYEAVLRLNPNDAVALNNLAFLIADLGGDLDQALTLAQRAKQLLPNLAEVSDTLGWIYLKKNLSDNAIDIFQQLVTKQPNQSTFRYHLGLALSQKGDRMRAVRELQQALKDNPPKEEKDKIQQLMGRLG